MPEVENEEQKEHMEGLGRKDEGHLIRYVFPNTELVLYKKERIPGFVHVRLPYGMSAGFASLHFALPEDLIEDAWNIIQERRKKQSAQS